MATPKASAQSEEWETVSEESATQVMLEVGDVFTGVKYGYYTIPNTEEGKPPLEFYTFRARGMEPNLAEGEICSILVTYKLKALEDINDGRLVRITRVKDVLLSGARQAMKDYKIQSRAA
jgi:hypothetical protein